ERDAYHKKAKELGYRSRAAFKLLEICGKTGLIKPGDAVVDLGAAPGGWLQVASELAGDSGTVVGVDLKPVEPIGNPNVSTVVGDIADEGVEGRILESLGRKADVVLSDASPNLTGVWELDQERQLDLASSSVRVARGVLRAGGAMVLKAFQGSSFNDLLSSLKADFESVDLFIPAATRKRSSEIYLICKGFLPKGFRRTPRSA
ncbi:MAG: RlmE family RNA methyltransferase, partial [Candidatus Brockarchaeota archaeon]|nr:RlmE family RNA methyltransferase [Candidatus Brockarchaeota archaeon]